MNRRMITLFALLVTNGTAHAVQELRPPSRSDIQTLQALPQVQPQAQPRVDAEPAPPVQPKAPEQAANAARNRSAASGTTGEEQLEKRYPDFAVAGAIHLALKAIDNARCGDGFCALASTAEWERPPVSIRSARQAMVVANISFQSKWCGIGMEQPVFLALMTTARREWKFDDRQAAIMAFIHGFVVGQLENRSKTSGPCPDTLRNQLLAARANAENAR